MAKKISANLTKKINAIKILALDVDGVMTDGRIIYDDSGKELKTFDVKDGHGIKLLMKVGIDIAIITARKSNVVLYRAKNLGIKMVYQNAINKIEALGDILKRRQLSLEEIAYMGDELIDIPILRRVGFAVAVRDATADVKKYADYITVKNGGCGAVREICDLILNVQGKWTKATEKYFIL